MRSQCIHTFLTRLGRSGPGSNQQSGYADQQVRRATNTSSSDGKAFHPAFSLCPRYLEQSLRFEISNYSQITFREPSNKGEKKHAPGGIVLQLPFWVAGEFNMKTGIRRQEDLAGWQSPPPGCGRWPEAFAGFS